MEEAAGQFMVIRSYPSSQGYSQLFLTCFSFSDKYLLLSPFWVNDGYLMPLKTFGCKIKFPVIVMTIYECINAGLLPL